MEASLAWAADKIGSLVMHLVIYSSKSLVGSREPLAAGRCFLRHPMSTVYWDSLCNVDNGLFIALVIPSLHVSICVTCQWFFYHCIHSPSKNEPQINYCWLRTSPRPRMVAVIITENHLQKSIAAWKCFIMAWVSRNIRNIRQGRTCLFRISHLRKYEKQRLSQVVNWYKIQPITVITLKILVNAVNKVISLLC